MWFIHSYVRKIYFSETFVNMQEYTWNSEHQQKVCLISILLLFSLFTLIFEASSNLLKNPLGLPIAYRTTLQPWG